MKPPVLDPRREVRVYDLEFYCLSSLGDKVPCSDCPESCWCFPDNEAVHNLEWAIDNRYYPLDIL